MLAPSKELPLSTFITSYIQHGKPSDALSFFQRMQKNGCSSLDGQSSVGLLNACTKLKDLNQGLEIHNAVAQTGLLEKDQMVARSVVDMYAKCGSLAKAHEVFDSLSYRDVNTWNTLITGYNEHGLSEEVLRCLDYMLLEGVLPDAATYICSLKACYDVGAINKVQEIHVDIARKGLLERSPLLGSTLLYVYAKYGLPVKAQEVFDKLETRDVVLWTALIAGYAESGHGARALENFDKMQGEGISPDAVSFVCSLKACGILKDKDKGLKIHAEISRKCLLLKNFVLESILVDMYVKCDLLANAREVFDESPVHNVVNWTTLIVGYADRGHGDAALECFKQMQFEGIPPNAVTIISGLKACGIVGAAIKGQEMHAEIERSELLDRDVFVANTLIDMYARCGLLLRAQEVFNKLAAPDIVSWNALVAGYADSGHGREALACYEQMQLKGMSPNIVTLVCLLKACGSMGATEKGVELHMEIVIKGLDDVDPVIGNILVDMYAKCGSPSLAQVVFDKLPSRDAFSWNSLIAGHAQTGESLHVFRAFEKMLAEGIIPGPITFVLVLNACSRAGLHDKSCMYFEAMSKDFGFDPYFEHHGCMVDLLTRVGQLDKALALTMKIPSGPNFVMWHTVLDACKDWGNVEIGRQAFEEAMLSVIGDAGC